ncbi:NAD(P)-dependent oxidoreductase, partial [Serratia marcescens]|uniref:NAD(P)-dependent oxidoreductase n=1 Tax=Serratia marcescens TaxID=615 RepID=UPI0035C6841C
MHAASKVEDIALIRQLRQQRLVNNAGGFGGIINQTLLAQLPDESYVLNLARGVHVVEEDLLAALDSGKLKG